MMTNTSGYDTSKVSSVAVSPSNNTSYVGDSASISYMYSLVSGGPYLSTFSGQKNANTYYIEATLSNANYVEQSLVATLTILPFEATVTWVGEAGSYTYSGHAQNTSISASYLLVVADGGTDMPLNVEFEYSIDDIEAYVAVDDFKNAGYYIVSVTSPDANYSFSSTITSHDLVIAKAVILRYMLDNSVSFDNTNHFISAGTSASVVDTSSYSNGQEVISLLSSDTATVYYTFTTDPLGFDYLGTWDAFEGAYNVGTYYLRGNINAGNNYQVWSDTATLQVNIADIVSITMTGATLTYDGQVHTITISSDETQHGLTVPVRYDMNPVDTANGGILNGAKSAGSYTIYAYVNEEGLTGYNSNYNELPLNVTLLINKATMYNTTDSSTSFYFTSESLTYDSYVYYVNVVLTAASESLSTSNITSIGIVPSNAQGYVGDSATVSYKYSLSSGGPYNSTFSGTKNAGTYYLEATMVNANYVSNSYTATLSISALSRSLTWSGDLATYTYNGFNQIGSISVYYVVVNDDIIGGDSQHEIDLATSLGYSLVSGGPFNSAAEFLTAGYYQFTAAMDNPNYSFTTVQKEIQINKADISLYFLSNTVTYNTSTHYISAGTSDTIVNTSAPAQISLFANDVATVTYTYTTDPLGFDYTGTWNAFSGAVNASTYYLKSEIKSADITNGYTNYNVWNNKQAVLTINTATITGISLTGGGTLTYDGQVHEVALSGTNTQYSEAVPFAYSMNPTDTAIVYGGGVYENRAKSAGYYLVSAVVNGALQAGYNANYKTLNLSSGLTINKAVMYNFTDSSTGFYFNDESITYDGIVYYINVKYTDVSGLSTSNVVSMDIRPSNATTFVGDTASVEYWYTNTYQGSYSTSFNGTKNANTYYLQAILKNSNYVEQSYESVFVSDQFDATVVWEGFLDTYTYNGLNQIESIGAYYTLVPADVSGGESHHYVSLSMEWSATGLSGSYSSIAAFMRAGYYTATVASDNPNYNFVHGTPTQVLTKDIEIDKANVNRFMVNYTLT
ncbi:MAG: hypothetical protein WCT23_10155, partial [Candidatus Neomarinimicrobiota bacterium]